MKRQILSALVLVLTAGVAIAKPLPKKIVKSETPTVDAEFAAQTASQSESEIPLDAKLVVNTQPPTPPAVANTASTAPVEAAASAPTPVESKAEVAKLPENQIPVFSETKTLKKADGSGLTRIMTTLAVLAALLGATYYGLKRLAKNKLPKNTNTKIRVLTQHALGPKKNLTIVQVAGETLLLGVTDQNISMLKTLALIDDELPEETPKRFDTALEDYEETDAEADEQERSRGRREPEEFAMRGLAEIRDTVSSRIRGFRNQ